MVTDAMDKIKEEYVEGDMLELDVENATLTNCRSHNTYELTKLSQTTFETLEAGGLINKVRIKLISRGEISE